MEISMNDSTSQQNPLAGHFRTAALYLELPSRGENYPAGSIVLPENGEVAIFPMTAKDEIALNTPDALMSGSATAQVIESCVPAIKDGFSVPTIDIDPLLIAIRIASSGEKMDFTNVCPKCEEENTYEVDLRNLLDDYGYVDFSEPLELNGLSIYFQPQVFRELNKLGLKAFNEQRALSVLENKNLSDDEKMEQFQTYLKTVSVVSIDITAGFIKKIVMTDGTEVIDRNHIYEFITNSNTKTYKVIEDKIMEFGEFTKSKPIGVQCRQCQHQYQTPIEFEASNFFG